MYLSVNVCVYSGKEDGTSKTLVETYYVLDTMPYSFTYYYIVWLGMGVSGLGGEGE